MTEGWIKIHRQLLDWQHFTEPTVLQVFLCLLLTANTKEKWVGGHRIGRGEVLTSTARIMELCGIKSHHTVDAAIRELVASGELDKVREGNFTKITINQYYKYQSTAINAQLTAQPTAQLTAQPTAQPIEQEYKERENINNIPPQSARAREGDFNILGTFHNVKLTDGDIEALKMDFSSQGLPDDFLDRCIDRLSAYMAQEGKTYHNHRAAILSWAKTAVLEDDRRTGARQPRPQSPAVSDEAEQRSIWAVLSEQDKQEYLNSHGGKYPWEQ